MVTKPFDSEGREEEVEMASPISVKPVNKEVKEAMSSPDYVPHPSRQPAYKDEKLEVHVDPVYVENVEYRTHEEQRAIEKKRNERIKTLAKQIYDTHEEERKRWEAAVKLVQSSSQEQKDNPTEALIEAMSIAKQGHPMTKKKAVELARKRLEQQN